MIAREKGLGPFKWQLLTILSWFILEGIGLLVALNWLGYNEIKTTNEMIAAVAKNPSITFFSLFCGFGGYLLMRYILEKKESAL